MSKKRSKLPDPRELYDAARVKVGDYVLLRYSHGTQVGYIQEVGEIKLSLYRLNRTANKWTGPITLDKSDTSILGFTDKPSDAPEPPALKE